MINNIVEVFIKPVENILNDLRQILENRKEDF